MSFLGEFLIEMSRLTSDRLPELIQIEIVGMLVGCEFNLELNIFFFKIVSFT